MGVVLVALTEEGPVLGLLAAAEANVGVLELGLLEGRAQGLELAAWRTGWVVKGIPEARPT